MANDKNDLVGQTLGTCTLQRLLGQGGMGAVYLARQARPARNVAVKVLLPNLALQSQDYQEFLARFRREADVIARLEHVNIMPIYEYGEQDGLAYLVMPYLAGGSLRDLLARQGALPPRATTAYIEQAASALDYAHMQGVIHRDLKPANFLLHADGRLVLADFGIARMIEASTPGATLTQTGVLLGTPEYMAPEMAQGEAIDYRVDIYELGIVLFQMLSGHVPFSGSTPYAVAVRHIQEPLPLLHQEKHEILAGVDTVIQRATAKRREDRYQTAQAMAQALREAITPPGSHASLPADYQEHVPTIISSATPPVMTSPSAPQYDTPSPQQKYLDEALRPQYEPQTNPPPRQIDYAPANIAAYQTPPAYHPQTIRKRRPGWLLPLILLVVALVIGGIFAGTQIGRTGLTSHLSPTATTESTPQTAATTTQAVYTATPASVATNAPPATPIPTSALPTAIPVGAKLYSSPSPGPGCDTGGGQWDDYNGARVDCQGMTTQISNTAHTATLQGIFLTGIPGQVYPANYIVQVQLQQAQNSSHDFGLYFRNQPGSQQGVYTFLIHPDGTWSAYVYNNSTGAPTEIAKGPFGDVSAPVTLTVVANGQQFSFYANGRPLGSVSNAIYPTGTAGIAVDQSANVTASNFTLYTIAA